MRFSEFGLGDELQEGLDMMGFKKATPIQVEAIPIITCIKISLMKKIEATRHFDYSCLFN